VTTGYDVMATMMAADDDNNEVDGDSATGHDDGDGATGDEVDDDGDDDECGNGQRRRQRDGQRRDGIQGR